eukprot:scaffold89902_cov23-Tisochrysis_lutea.AAC.7
MWLTYQFAVLMLCSKEIKQHPLSPATQFRPVMVYKFGAVDLDRLKAVTTDERITLFHIQVRCEKYGVYMELANPSHSLISAALLLV